MCRQAEALKEQATMIANDLAGSCLGLKDNLKDLSAFDERNNLQKKNIDALEESISKSFVELPDGRKLFSWEYEALERFTQDNQKDVNHFFVDNISIENSCIVRVSFCSMSIKDISALSGLENLRELYLYKNQIRNISALSALKNLQVLELDKNKIQDIAVLLSLRSLKELSISENEIEDPDAAKNIINTLRERRVVVYE